MKIIQTQMVQLVNSIDKNLSVRKRMCRSFESSWFTPKIKKGARTCCAALHHSATHDSSQLRHNAKHRSLSVWRHHSWRQVAEAEGEEGFSGDCSSLSRSLHPRMALYNNKNDIALPDKDWIFRNSKEKYVMECVTWNVVLPAHKFDELLNDDIESIHEITRVLFNTKTKT